MLSDPMSVEKLEACEVAAARAAEIERCHFCLSVEFPGS
jgi:hypothetical protein